MAYHHERGGSGGGGSGSSGYSGAPHNHLRTGSTASLPPLPDDDDDTHVHAAMMSGGGSVAGGVVGGGGGGGRPLSSITPPPALDVHIGTPAGHSRSISITSVHGVGVGVGLTPLAASSAAASTAPFTAQPQRTVVVAPLPGGALDAYAAPLASAASASAAAAAGAGGGGGGNLTPRLAALRAVADTEVSLDLSSSPSLVSSAAAITSVSLTTRTTAAGSNADLPSARSNSSGTGSTNGLLLLPPASATPVHHHHHHNLHAFDGVGQGDADNPTVHDVERQRLKCGERLSNVAKLMKSTHHCLILYIVLMTLNLFVVIWELSTDNNVHWVVLLVEGCVNFLLVVEVSLSVMADGCTGYFRHWMHVVDVVVTSFCVLFFIIFVAYDETRRAKFNEGGADDPEQRGDDTAAFIDSFLLVGRYMVQILRLMFFVWRSRATAERATVDDIPADLSAAGVTRVRTGTGLGGHSGTGSSSSSAHPNRHGHSRSHSDSGAALVSSADKALHGTSDDVDGDGGVTVSIDPGTNTLRRGSNTSGGSGGGGGQQHALPPSFDDEFGLAIDRFAAVGGGGAGAGDVSGDALALPDFDDESPLQRHRHLMLRGAAASSSSTSNSVVLLGSPGGGAAADDHCDQQHFNARAMVERAAATLAASSSGTVGGIASVSTSASTTASSSPFSVHGVSAAAAAAAAHQHHAAALSLLPAADLDADGADDDFLGVRGDQTAAGASAADV